MNKSILLRTYMASVLLCLTLFASCSADDDTELPDGKYPMTFATAMEGLTQTRSTTDNTWKGSEKIAVQVGNEVKQYIPTSSNPSTLTGVDATNTFYWQKAEETVSAWYSGAGYHATLPTSFSVKLDQRTDDYQKSDFLYAKPQNIKYSDRTTAPLIFKHLPAKVVVNLKYGDGLTEQDVTDATVSIINQATTSGTINAADGTVAQVTTSVSNEITPNAMAATLGYQQSVQAIVVPQQLAKGTKFIKVTIGEGTDAARDYYYTTKTDTEVNLECGKQYTYNITVTKGEELVVTNQTAVTWKDGTAQSGTVTPATSFNVTCPSGNGVDDLNISNAIALSGDKYTVNPNQSITISYKTTFKRSRYNLVQGIAKVSTSTNPVDGTITLTVSEIRGDLVFSFDKYVFAEVGDYYYADGTWSPDYTSGSGSPACIGIIFKVGAGTGDDASYYGSKLPNGIHGYVAALKDANNGELLAWSTENTATGVSTSQANFDGYSNTQIIKRISGYETKYPAFQSCIENNGTAAPTASSGWYLPSCAQIQTFNAVCGSTPVSNNLSIAGGALLINDRNGIKPGDYWTSNEDAADRTKVWHFATYVSYQVWNDHPKTDSTRDLVRAILTF
uniref:fimbrillin family protein n=1 Tax=uncultured Bacteroides sp. TaxID=162156 RepID=UPI0025F2A991|nr:fimbrillin family protein [uncultured Bacteroides sp.]